MFKIKGMGKKKRLTNMFVNVGNWQLIQCSPSDDVPTVIATLFPKSSRSKRENCASRSARPSFPHHIKIGKESTFQSTEANQSIGAKGIVKLRSKGEMDEGRTFD